MVQTFAQYEFIYNIVSELIPNLPKPKSTKKRIKEKGSFHRTPKNSRIYCVLSDEPCISPVRAIIAQN